jgi:hypothetical protein
LKRTAITKELMLLRQEIELANRRIADQRRLLAEARATGGNAEKEAQIVASLKTFRDQRITRRERLKREQAALSPETNVRIEERRAPPRWTRDDAS